MINSLIIEFKNQKVLIENYVYLTAVQLINTLFYFLIYPLSLKIFGASNYGLFLFSTTIISYISLFISFGIDLPALKILSQNLTDKKVKSDLLSDVVTTKIALSLVSLIPLFLLMWLYPDISKLLLVNSLQAFSSIFLLNWYFQGIQKMRWFVIFQFIIKLIAMILLFLIVKNTADLMMYSLVISGSVFMIAFLSFLFLVYKENIHVRLVTINRVFIFIKQSYHFFLNASISIVRAQSTTLFVGSFVGMSQVSYFDLASKIILLPQSIVSNINNALLPKILSSKKLNSQTAKKVFFYEFIIGLFFIVIVILFGKSAIRLFIDQNIELIHNITIIISLTIMSWLLVGCIVNFIFIPIGRYDLISKNQIIAFLSFFAFCFIGLFIEPSVYIVAFGIAFSALLEILFCISMVIKLGLLRL